jgi:hypothetical protein
MYKKIAQFGALSLLVSVAGGLWGIEQYLDYTPGLRPSPLVQDANRLTSSALAGGASTGESMQEKGEEYYIKNSEQIDADLSAMQTKVLEIWKLRYPLVASACDLAKIQESFDGNDKIPRTVCKSSRIAGVVANRFLSRIFDYPDNRPVMEEMIALKWALINTDAGSDTSMK